MTFIKCYLEKHSLLLGTRVRPNQKTEDAKYYVSGQLVNDVHLIL